jgi:hypothetical protein
MGVETEVEKKEDYIHFKLKGEFPGLQILNGMDMIIEVTRKYKIFNILLDIRDFNYDLSGMESFSVGEYISKTYSNDLIRIACLRNLDKKDDFTEIVAQNRGAVFKLFNNESEAISWLKE